MSCTLTWTNLSTLSGDKGGELPLLQLTMAKPRRSPDGGSGFLVFKPFGLKTSFYNALQSVIPSSLETIPLNSYQKLETTVSQ